MYSAVQCSAVQCSAEQCPAGRTGTEATFIRGALHCTVLVHYILILPSDVLHFMALHCTGLHCTKWHCTVMHFSVLNCTALKCTLLHCSHTALCDTYYWGNSALRVGIRRTAEILWINYYIRKFLHLTENNRVGDKTDNKLFQYIK